MARQAPEKPPEYEDTDGVFRDFGGAVMISGVGNFFRNLVPHRRKGETWIKFRYKRLGANIFRECPHCGTAIVSDEGMYAHDAEGVCPGLLVIEEDEDGSQDSDNRADELGGGDDSGQTDRALQASRPY